MNQRNALNQYKQIGAETSIMDADPHRLIQLLLDGALDRLAQAKGALANNDPAATSEALSKAMSIITALQGWLDHDKGGEIAANLNDLYDYMNRRLFDVHKERNASPIDEVGRLLGDIKSGWDGIREEALKH